MPSPPPSSPEQLRRRVEGWRAAERRERALRRAKPLDPIDALEAAFELCELDAGLVDPVRDREVEHARATWRRLRRRLGWQGANRD